MSNENDYTCGMCKNYNSDMCECEIHPEYGLMLEEDTCDDWEDDNEPTEEEIEAQRTDAAERENHRKEVEDEDIPD